MILPMEFNKTDNSPVPKKVRRDDTRMNCISRNIHSFLLEDSGQFVTMKNVGKL